MTDDSKMAHIIASDGRYLRPRSPACVVVENRFEVSIRCTESNVDHSNSIALDCKKAASIQLVVSTSGSATP